MKIIARILLGIAAVALLSLAFSCENSIKNKEPETEIAVLVFKDGSRDTIQGRGLYINTDGTVFEESEVWLGPSSVAIGVKYIKKIPKL